MCFRELNSPFRMSIIQYLFSHSFCSSHSPTQVTHSTQSHSFHSISLLLLPLISSQSRSFCSFLPIHSSFFSSLLLCCLVPSFHSFALDPLHYLLPYTLVPSFALRSFPSASSLLRPFHSFFPSPLTPSFPAIYFHLFHDYYIPTSMKIFIAQKKNKTFAIPYTKLFVLPTKGAFFHFLPLLSNQKVVMPKSRVIPSITSNLSSSIITKIPYILYSQLCTCVACATCATWSAACAACVLCLHVLRPGCTACPVLVECCEMLR